MSGALNSVMGGGGGMLGGLLGGSGGGSILGDIGGVIGMEFGPIGSMIGEAVGNMLQQVVTNAVSQAGDQLQQQSGMPPFVNNMLKDTANAQASQNQSNVPADVQQDAQDKFGAIMSDMTNQLGSAIASSAAQRHKESGQTGAGGWLEAIAQAMGDCLGQQASALVDLSNKMQADMPTPATGATTGTGTAAPAGTGMTAGTGAATGTGAAAGAPANKTSTNDTNTAQAAKFNEDMTQFQALSQQYSILQNTFTTAIKSLGEALQGMARKS